MQIYEKIMIGHLSTIFFIFAEKMLYQIIKERINIWGLSQVQVANAISTTPSQFGLYLRGDASLKNESLEKCLQVLDINVDTYHYRYQLAKELAGIFLQRKLTSHDVLEMSKNQMVSATGRKEVATLIDVNETELKAIIDAKLVDYESTYPHFRLMVAHLMNMGDKVTVNKSSISFALLVRDLDVSLTAGFFGKLLLSGPMMIGAFANVAAEMFMKVSFMAPWALLTLFSLKKKKNA